MGSKKRKRVKKAAKPASTSYADERITELAAEHGWDVEHIKRIVKGKK